MRGNGGTSKQTGVPGWETDAEAEAMVAIAASLPEESVYVELGGEYGRSASQVAFANPTLQIITVDLFPSDHYLVGDLFTAYRNNLVEAGLWDETRFDQIIGETAASGNEWRNVYNDRQIDMLLIDAGHNYNEVKADINAWLPHVADGGYVLFHDYATSANSHPLHWEVRRAVDEWWNERGKDDYEFIQQVDSLRVYRRKSSELGLGDIPGIGESRQKALVKMGITTLEALIEADAVEVSKTIGRVTVADVEKWQAYAADLTGI